MDIVDWKDVTDVKIATFPYRGKPYEVKGISVRWLSKFGDDGHGYPEYGLRLFTAQPGGEIPIHNHFYIQTMHILSGRFECYQFDPQTDQRVKTAVCGPGTAVVIPSLQPHGMRNLSDTEPATFLCCICNVYEKESL
ncbi:MAG: cupin domain-containing protein [Desulfobacteraceae bacterium]|nr:MAG: cupin domain-containing protein [Desulfobacteraceae bacterium]